MNTATGSKARPLWGVVAIAAVCLRVYAEPAHKAESVVDSVGINVHLHYTDTAYFQQFSEVKQALLALHVRHLRDGLVDHPRPEYLERYKLLGSLGMKTVFITKPDQPALELASRREPRGRQRLARRGLRLPHEDHRLAANATQ